MTKSGSLILSRTCMDISNLKNKEALLRSQDKQDDIVVISSTHVMKNVESKQIVGFQIDTINGPINTRPMTQSTSIKLSLK